PPSSSSISNTLSPSACRPDLRHATMASVYAATTFRSPLLSSPATTPAPVDNGNDENACCRTGRAPWSSPSASLHRACFAQAPRMLVRVLGARAMPCSAATTATRTPCRQRPARPNAVAA
ncbi:unnamed protein product, partial [Ectocarpus sp. 12 AP-2014]